MPKKITRVKKTCESCSGVYGVFKYKQETAKYCSRECYKATHKAPQKECLECGNEFVKPGNPYQKYCSRECYSKNITPPPPRYGTGKDHPGIRKKMGELGLDWEEFNNWKEDKLRYRKEVWRITNQQQLSLLENYDKPRTKAGVEGGYQLDHKISIIDGWNSKINPYIIGGVDNLQFIPWEENLKKRYD